MTAVRGRTRWSRFAVIITVSAGLAGGLVVATASAALPTSFALSGANFKFSADRVEGRGFAQFVGLSGDTGSGRKPMAVTGLGTAKVRNLCFSALVPTPGRHGDHSGTSRSRRATWCST